MSTLKKYFGEWFDALFVALIVAFFLRTFVVESYRIPTGSMEQTLLAGDFLFVNKFTYGAKVPFTDWRLPAFSQVKHGDIIVFKFPKDRSLNYIKRCIALSGDTLEIRNQQVFVNGKVQQLPEHAQFIDRKIPVGIIDLSIFPEGAPYNKDNYGPIRIPHKGDVIQLSSTTYPLYSSLLTDEGHTVNLVGRQVFVDGVLTESYTVQQNYYFAMGDNRDNSLDSRFWGFLPEKDLVGQALMVYWSWNPDISIFSDPVNKIASIRWDRPGFMVH